VSKSNLDEEPFVQVWTISILKSLSAFFKLNNIHVIFDHGLFCSKRNKENGTFLFDISEYEMFLLKYHYNKLYLAMYLAVSVST